MLADSKVSRMPGKLRRSRLAVVIGAAFGAIVASLVADIIMRFRRGQRLGLDFLELFRWSLEERYLADPTSACRCQKQAPFWRMGAS